MITPGLVSITFRQLQPLEIVELVKQAGLIAIEWGGDVHVPHGDVERAKQVRHFTEDAGLQAASYGSYYRVGVAHADALPFETILDTCYTLGAPVVRVWAGDRATAHADDTWWETCVNDTRRVAGMAQDAGIELAFEYHGGTLTDSGPNARRFLEAVDHPNVQCYWQPTVNSEPETRMANLEAVTPWLRHVHIFHWTPGMRLPLAEGRDEWAGYLRHVSETGRSHGALLEFVEDNAPESFLRDAATLKEILSEL
jgi:sugar phosphate isomerase/epimerase